MTLVHVIHPIRRCAEQSEMLGAALLAGFTDLWALDVPTLQWTQVARGSGPSTWETWIPPVWLVSGGGKESNMLVWTAATQRPQSGGFVRNIRNSFSLCPNCHDIDSLPMFEPPTALRRG